MRRNKSSGELKRGEDTKAAITELKSLMHGRRIWGNSAGNSEIPGPFSGGIAKSLIYGKETRYAVGMEIGEIEKAICDFPDKRRTKRTGKKRRNGWQNGDEAGNSGYLPSFAMGPNKCK